MVNINKYKEYFLQLLNDDEVKVKIIDLVNKNKLQQQKIEFKNLNMDLNEKFLAYKNEIGNLKNALRNERNNNSELNKALEIEKIKNRELVNEFNRTLEKEQQEKSIINNELIKYKQVVNYRDTEIIKNKQVIEDLNIKCNLMYQDFIKIKQINDNYENAFKELINNYSKYIQLRDEIKLELSNVVKYESPEIFLSSGVQWENIEALWSFISYKLDEYSEFEIGILTNIFNYFFSKYTKINNLYDITNVNIGDEFDEDLHTRGYSSRVTGSISKILLKGYKNTRTDRIIQKSIVRI